MELERQLFFVLRQHQAAQAPATGMARLDRRHAEGRLASRESLEPERQQLRRSTSTRLKGRNDVLRDFFEVLPHAEQRDNYFDIAKALRPELEKTAGFIDNIRYKSLTREGWLLSHSSWRDEKSLVRWRTHGSHHDAQQEGRDAIFADYHLRVGQVTGDSQLPAGQVLAEHRLDETEAGEGTTVTLINATRPTPWQQTNNPYDCAEWLGLNPWSSGSLSWDIFEAILAPGDLILLVSWKDAAAAQAYEDTSGPSDKARIRRIRIVRDYGKYDRREAPLYSADAAGGDTIHP